MTVNLKRGRLFGAVCAAAGFLLTLVPLFWQTPLCRPGVFLWAVLLDVCGIGRDAIGHGAIWPIVVTNPISEYDNWNTFFWIIVIAGQYMPP